MARGETGPESDVDPHRGIPRPDIGDVRDTKTCGHSGTDLTIARATASCDPLPILLLLWRLLEPEPGD